MTPRFLGLMLTTIALLVGPAIAADAPASAPDTKGEWVPIPANRGHLGSLAVDRATGNLFWSGWHSSGVQMSSDQAKTFARVTGPKFDGNPFSVLALFASAEGNKIAAFCSQKGTLSGHSLDGGKTWTTWTLEGGPIPGFDYGVVDWDSGTIFAFPHEEYKSYLSTDMGKTWTHLDLGYPAGTNNPHQAGQYKYYQPGIGAFSATELVYSQEKGIQRSDDAGKTWAKVADYCCVGQVQVLNKVGYWLAKKETDGKWSGILLKTEDKGKTWQPVGKPIDNGDSFYMSLPRFGKDAKHILIAAAAGIMETTDGGETWKLAVRYPAPFAAKRLANCVDTTDCLEYDPIHDVFYMFIWIDGQRTWKYQR